MEVEEDLYRTSQRLRQDAVMLERFVAEGREAGLTWGRIGGLLGISAQLAHYRYGRST
jgi:hypothetical protein